MADEAPTLPKRGPLTPAGDKQLVSYILTDKTFIRHRTIGAARTEREYLEAKTGKKFKLMKVIHCGSEELLDGTVQVSRGGRVFDPHTGNLRGEPGA